MTRDAKKDKFVREYFEGLRKLPDSDYAIDAYRAKNNLYVKKLFGDWIGFNEYQIKYPENISESIIPNKQIPGNLNQENLQKKDLGRIIEIPSIKKALREAGFEYPSKKKD